MADVENERKDISKKDWYDFIGDISNIIPALYLGGVKATGVLLEMCNLTAETIVLDIGCGSGYTACKIVKEYGSKVTGIDISEIMVAKAKHRAQKERLEDLIEFRVANVFSLPFEDDSFDVALFESVLTPLPGDKLEALHETLRVLRVGGLVGVNESFILPSGPEEALNLAREHPAIYGMFTPEGLKDLLERSGLEIIEMSEVRSSEAPSMTRELGILGMLSFMVKSYPRILWKLITDSRFRRAAKVDERLTKYIREYGGYILVVGRVPD